MIRTGVAKLPSGKGPFVYVYNCGAGIPTVHFGLHDAGKRFDFSSAVSGFDEVLAKAFDLDFSKHDHRKVISLEYRDGKLTVEWEEPETKGQELARKLRERASLTADEEWLATLRTAADLLEKQ